MGSLGDFNINIVNYWVLIPAISIIGFLSFLEKRKSRQDLCNGRPALPIPFRFLDGYENRVAYALTFGTATSSVMSIIVSGRTLGFDLPLWSQAIYVYMQAMIGCLTCYPLFACLTTRHRALGAILCLMYSLLWLSIEFVVVAQVVEKTSQNNISEIEKNIQNVTQAGGVLIVSPIMFCYLTVIIRCSYTLYTCYITKTYREEPMESTVRLHQLEHVRWVLRKFKMNCLPQEDKNCNSSQTFLEQMKHNKRLKYLTNFPFFKYPTRIVAMAFVQLNILYWAAIVMMMGTANILLFVIEFLHTFIGTDSIIVAIVGVSLGFAIIVCILNGLIQIFLIIRNYRYDMFRVYKGSKAFVPVRNMSPQNILVRSMTFPGYQVAFMLWGILLCCTTVFLFIVVPAMLVYVSSEFDMLSALFTSLAEMLSFPAAVLLIFYILVFLTKLVLLQEKVKETDKDPPLNVDNRKLYEIICYYSLFTNMAVGLFTCLFRIIESAVFGICSVGRLDRSVFPQELESMDRGNIAYKSMLLVDNAHNNPCMRVFAHLLWTKTLARRLGRAQEQEDASESVNLHSKSRHIANHTTIRVDELSRDSNNSEKLKDFTQTKEIGISSQASIRWHLMYTLINNYQLCQLRKQKVNYNKSTE